jgi:phosphoglycerate dehydrogenase-like enzyme
MAQSHFRQAKFRIGITPSVLNAAGRTIYDPAMLEVFDRPGIEWAYTQSAGPDISPQDAADFDAMCVMLGRVTPATFAGANRRLKLIARFGVGYDTIDVPACTENGVLVAIAPDGVRRPVATSVITFVLALAQKLLIKDKLTRAGRWGEKLDHVGMGVTGRVLGTIGLGNIGADVFRLAQPFGMRHLAADPYASPDLARELKVELCDLDTLLRTADFVSVNCPLSESTRGLIGARELSLMKPTAYLINTARGPIVQEQALYEALRAGRIAGAGLDVFELEPAAATNPLFALDNVIVTPHGLCFTDECLNGLARSAFGAAMAVASGRAPPHLVNSEALKHPALAHLRS